ncbi:MAG: murein biosynthesis integral membrane protein MurJ, partial [Candidatus Poribacteria bacterium]
SIPGKFELTVRMTRTMFPFFPLVALAAAFMGVLNACGIFFMPALSSALFNITSIIVGVACAVFFSGYGAKFGLHPIEGMAIGVLTGGLMQAVCQLPSLYKTGYKWVAQSREEYLPWYKEPYLRQILLLMVPGTIGLAATQVNILINTILATSQGTGAVSWLNYAFRLMQFPIGVFGVSLAIATLPTFSQQLVSRDMQSASETLSRSLRHVFAINLPASAGLAFLGIPIIKVIFQYGRFQVEDTHATALALTMYAIGLTAYSAVKILVPACYAFGNTRVPVVSSVLAVLVTICLNLLLIGPFGYWGLALGTSVAAVVNAVYLIRAIQLMFGKYDVDFPVMPIIKAFGSHLVIAVLMGAACLGTNEILEILLPDTFLGTWLPFVRAMKMSILLLEGIFIVFILAKMLNLSETSEIFSLFFEKFKKKLRVKAI